MFWANESWAPWLQIKHETKNCEDVVSKPFQSLSVREMWVMQTFCLVKLHFSRKSHSSRLRYFMAWQNLTNLFWSWFVQGPAATLNIVSTWSALYIINPPLVRQKEGRGNCSTPPHSSPHSSWKTSSSSSSKSSSISSFSSSSSNPSSSPSRHISCKLGVPASASHCGSLRELWRQGGELLKLWIL